MTLFTRRVWFSKCIHDRFSARRRRRAAGCGSRRSRSCRDEYHLLVPDLPEHGQSADVKPMTLQNAAAQVAELIRTRAHGGRAHVVGLSLGAQTTIELLSQSPELIDHAIASGPLMRPLPGIGTTNLMAKMYWPFRNMKWLVKWNMQGLGVPAEYFEEFRQRHRRADHRWLCADDAGERQQSRPAKSASRHRAHAAPRRREGTEDHA